MSAAPWLSPEGDLRCFYCETRAAHPGRNKDPDAVNPHLRDAHRVLWSRTLPGGQHVGLSARRWSDYLTVRTGGGWTLGSDNIATIHSNALPTFSRALEGVADGHLCQFCTIGGYIVFPNQLAQQLPTRVNPVARRWSINQARGMESRISDRFDLTVEAIRLYYEGVVHRSENPLGDVLEAYRWWFELFGTGADGFLTYAEFFFLTPMLEANGRVVPFGPLGLAFDRALPDRDEGAYRAYIADQSRFVAARNDLILIST